MTKRDYVMVAIAVVYLVTMLLFLAIYLSKTKFCPECGRRYITDEFYCKYDGAELKDIG